MWRLSGRPDRRVKVENTNVTNLAEKAGHHTCSINGYERFSRSVVRNPDFIYKQVHNPDVTNPDLAVSGLRTCL